MKFKFHDIADLFEIEEHKFPFEKENVKRMREIIQGRYIGNKENKFEASIEYSEQKEKEYVQFINVYIENLQNVFELLNGGKDQSKGFLSNDFKNVHNGLVEFLSGIKKMI